MISSKGVFSEMSIKKNKHLYRWLQGEMNKGHHSSLPGANKRKATGAIASLAQRGAPLPDVSPHHSRQSSTGAVSAVIANGTDYGTREDSAPRCTSPKASFSYLRKTSLSAANLHQPSQTQQVPPHVRLPINAIDRDDPQYIFRKPDRWMPQCSNANDV